MYLASYTCSRADRSPPGAAGPGRGPEPARGSRPRGCPAGRSAWTSRPDAHGPSRRPDWPSARRPGSLPPRRSSAYSAAGGPEDLRKGGVRALEGRGVERLTHQRRLDQELGVREMTTRRLELSQRTRHLSDRRPGSRSQVGHVRKRIRQEGEVVVGAEPLIRPVDGDELADGARTERFYVHMLSRDPEGLTSGLPPQVGPSVTPLVFSS